MTINYTEIGRDKLSWAKQFKNGATEDQIASEAKRGGRLMSSCVDAIIDDSGHGGEIIVGGFRCVGKFTISNQ